MTSPFPTTEPAAIIGEAVAGTAATIRKLLEEKIGLIERSKFDVAELLWEIDKNKYYTGYGFDTYLEYVKSVGLKESKARYLRDMARVMAEVECERYEYEPLGIGKLRAITSLDPKSNYLDPKTKELIPMRDFIIGFVDEGQNMTLKEILEHVRVLKGQTGDDEMVFTNLYTKRIVKESVLLPAFEAAKLLIGSVGRDENGDAVMAKDGRAAEVIAVEFLNTAQHNPVAPSIGGEPDAEPEEKPEEENS